MMMSCNDEKLLSVMAVSVDFAEFRVDVINYDGSLMKNWNHRKLLNYCAGSYCYNCY